MRLKSMRFVTPSPHPRHTLAGLGVHSQDQHSNLVFFIFMKAVFQIVSLISLVCVSMMGLNLSFDFGVLGFLLMLVFSVSQLTMILDKFSYRIESKSKAKKNSD